MASVLDLVKHYQHAIEKYPNDEQRILKCIDKLFHLDVTVQHLQETGVGRTVNALRKEPGDVGQASRALVYKWKVMVAAEESDQEGDHRIDTSNDNDRVSERDSEDGIPKSKSRHDHNAKPSKLHKRSPDEQKHKHLNGDSGSKRRYQYSEEHEPEVKKSRQLTNNDERYKRKDLKKEPHEIETQDPDISETDNSESDTSQSSQEIRKQRHKIKEEKLDYDKLSHSSKNTSHSSYKSDAATEKVCESSGKHSKHRSESKKSDKSQSVEKSSSSHKQSSSKDKEGSRKDRSNHKPKDKEKKDSESSNKLSSKKESSSKHKSYSEKISSDTSVKHNNLNDKAEKHKSLSTKETSSDRLKSKGSSSSVPSSSTNDKSKEKHTTSKDSDHGKKSDKKHSSESRSKNSNTDKHGKEKKDSEKSDDKRKKHSSSSSKSYKSSSTKTKDEVPNKRLHVSNSEDSEDGIDCGSGASFAEALGMISPAKPKKKTAPIKDIQSPSSFTDLSPASLLAPTAKLAPLPALEISALPEISPNYKPRPPPKLIPHFTDEDAMSHVISSKNQRTKVYSGNKVLGKIPTLYEMCVHILQEHIDALEFTGGVPYEILKPVVDKATPQQLFMLEHYNPYLMEDTDHLWQKFCEKHFRNKQRQEMETWREMYMRCQEEQEHRLKSLTANIKIAQEAKKAPIKQTKMAYVDTVVKPPRNILRKQALHGTAHASTASPAARVASLAAAPNVLRGGSVRPPPAAPVSTSSMNKAKKGPLMQKALQFFRGRKR
ncbi:transcription elongation factor B polypeptide 3-like [Battus philenor]|uniref:transcription elongation factor B polypeptide 3-like n=1 Tax=Battus philenor TaxID=42288 RepID=UPI0035CFF849